VQPSFSASSIRGSNKSLDEGLRAFAEGRLVEPFPYLIRWRWPAASLDRGCARRHPNLRSGRRNGPFGRTKKRHSLPDLFAELPGHNWKGHR